MIGIGYGNKKITLRIGLMAKVDKWSLGIKKQISETVFFKLLSLSAQNSKLKHDVKVAAEKNNDMNDSIRYAKRIQDAMMPKEKHLKKLFPNSFLFYKPKDIVSGDFYWFTKIDDKILLAVADCTGHGIPGAFMSVLGISLLNQIVIEEQYSSTSLILQRLHHKIRKAFATAFEKPEEETQHDGMDVALCSIDYDAGTIEFSGAFRPIYLLDINSQLTEIKGARYPIGGAVRDKERLYKSTLLPLSKGDKLYLFSDGYVDQFGGTVNRKLMSNRFKTQIQKSSHLPMHAQMNELEKLFDGWKGHEEQTDDVLVLGLEL